MTVSRVINRMGNVKEQTLAAVNAAIARLNYAPNPAARSLAGAQQIRVGLLYSNPSAAYLSELLVGAVEEASHCHVQLIIEKCPPTGDGLSVARQLVADGVDGLILPPPMCDSRSLITFLVNSSTPCVVIASGVPSNTFHRWASTTLQQRTT